MKTNFVTTVMVVASSAIACSGGTTYDTDSTTTRSQNVDGMEPREWRQLEVDEYHRRISDGWVIVETRQSPSGQIIDYVLAETRYPDNPEAPFAKPPFEVKTDSELALPDGTVIMRGGTELSLEKSLEKPLGTIPVIRMPFTEYVENGDAYANLDDFMSKLPVPANETAMGKLYGRQRNTTNNTDSNAYINLWRFGEVLSTDLSVMQLSQACTTPGGVLETVEAGIARVPSVFSDNNLHIFTYFTKTGYTSSGNYIGGWNLDHAGFKQWANATSAPGSTVSSSTISTIDGTQYECLIEYTLADDGNWWVYACDNWLGYYPGANSADAQRINWFSLSSKSCRISWYGEVESQVTNSSAWGATNMGSGRYASEGYRKAAYIRAPNYYWDDGNMNTYDWHPLVNAPFRSTATNSGYDAACYTVGDIGPLAGSSAHQAFFLGGPGYNGGTNGCQ